MKKPMLIVVIGIALFLGGCGCFSVEEKVDPVQQRIEDSIDEIDRNSSVDDADRMLREADSIEKVKQDSIDKAQK